MDNAWHLAAFGIGLDLVPEQEEKFHVSFEIRAADILRHGADNKTSSLGPELLDCLAQSLPDVLIGNLTGNADMIGQRHEDKVTTGQGDMAGETGPLGADGFLGNLDKKFLTLMKKIINGWMAVIFGGGHGIELTFKQLAITVLVLGRGPLHHFVLLNMDIIDIEKPGPVQSYVNKGGLHAGQNSDNPAPVNVSDQSLFRWTFKMNFLKIVLVDQRNPVFIGGGIDENFCLHEKFLQAEGIGI
jgi:hypothetical protein